MSYTQVLIKESSNILDAQEWINAKCIELRSIVAVSCKAHLGGDGLTNYISTIIYKMYE